jgi:pimeloyl-ACP methyl ester carboxylesterase
MPRAIVNGINIHYQQAGSGPHLVLIHGLTGSLAAWQWQFVPALSDRFNVLTYDLRGHGHSDMPPSGYTSADMARDLAALLDERGIDRAHLVGHSFGGLVALHLAALAPERVNGLTISDTRIRAFQDSQKLKDWAHWPLWKSQLRQRGVTLDEDSELDYFLLERLALQRPTAPVPLEEPTGSTEPPAWLQPGWVRGPRWAERWQALMSGTTAGPDLRDQAVLTAELIRGIRVPTQAIYAELSFCLASLAGLRENMPNLKATVLPGVGHFYPFIQPALLLEHLIPFHAEASAAPGGPAVGWSPSR